MNTPNLITRRSFLRQAACAAVGTAGVTNALFDLRRLLWPCVGSRLTGSVDEHDLDAHRAMVPHDG